MSYLHYTFPPMAYDYLNYFIILCETQKHILYVIGSVKDFISQFLFFLLDYGKRAPRVFKFNMKKIIQLIQNLFLQNQCRQI